MTEITNMNENFQRGLALMEFLTNSLQNNSSFKWKPSGNASRSAKTYHLKDQI